MRGRLRAVALVGALAAATPALAAGGHDGTAGARTGPELSDVALAGMAAAGLWLARRAHARRAASRTRRPG